MTDRRLDTLRVAIIHDWLTGLRGGEKCLHELLGVLPNAEVFTLFYRRGSQTPRIESVPIHVSKLGRLPRVAKYYRNLLPLLPRAIERFDLTGFDAVVSISHCVAKGAIPPEGAPHLCYCLTPVRYAWDLFDEYFAVERVGRFKHFAAKKVTARLRKWDAASSDRVTDFVAISRHVADRIERHYGRASQVIYPPVECERFRVGETKDDFYLAAGAFAPYKRFDLAIEACKRLGRRLIVVGGGQDEPRLRKLAGPTIEFVGRADDETLADLYRRARAYLFPGEEDFGITPVEANASGTPVVAFGKGGATETIVGDDDPEGRPPTGVLFREPSARSLADALERLDHVAIDPADCRRQALRFDVSVFRAQIHDALVAAFL